MNNEYKDRSIPRWLVTDDWLKLLEAHLDPHSDIGLIVDRDGAPRWKEESPFLQRATSGDLETYRDSSVAAVWLEDTGPTMLGKLKKWWPKLRAGGYIGGPSFGFGFTSCGAWTMDTEVEVRKFVATIDDCSELLLGHCPHACWFVFKLPPQSSRILLLSGADTAQSESFGPATRANHAAYCAEHGYSYRWHDWDSEWQEGRHPVWRKIAAVIQVLKEESWDQVWWIDADAGFVDLNKCLHKYLHPDWSAVHPEFMDNGRVMASTGVWGSTDRALPGLVEVWSRSNRGYGFYTEELCMSDSIHERPDLWSKTQLVDHRLFNGIPHRGISYHKGRDNFVIHLAGRSNLERKDIFEAINLSIINSGNSPNLD